MYPLRKGLYAKQAHLNLPEGTYEEEHGREGFYGKVSHLYRLHPPTSWTRIEGNLKPRAYNCNIIENDEKAHIILYNSDLVIYTHRLTRDMPYYYRNADGDEVRFIHEGQGVLETDFGAMAFTKGDYLVIPRGTTYRIKVEQPIFCLLVESFSEINQPERGLLGPNALYDPATIETPEPSPIIDDREWELKIKRLGEETSVFYPFNPIDVVGWKGDLSVWKISIKDICPVISHRAHIPPSVHSTFIGSKFVICSFVPRPLESEEGALKVPFYHRNIDYDEVIFYHDGDFFSRDGIKPGTITFHPQGIHHGPHPKALKNSSKKEKTDEYAVMIDARNPLIPSEDAQKVEWKEYYMSWKE
ncbi:MAG: homogentisate 1,2-dioxygenase [Candidatus Sericytochromatia bacterium]|nr:homogentisate 1,2-dioxygenase [Candidatus Sericytochromatia bacterium]